VKLNSKLLHLVFHHNWISPKFLHHGKMFYFFYFSLFLTVNAVSCKLLHPQVTFMTCECACSAPIGGGGT
jgi:hypothetical protein